MSQAAATSQAEYVVTRIPLNKIYADEAFNCRGVIGALDVSDLVSSIKERGLDAPIVLQPRSDVKNLADGFDFRIISGHRRFLAYNVLNRTEPTNEKFQTIPAFVRPGLTEIAARVMNLSENLDRKELNILQESFAIKGLYEAGVPRDHVAGMLKKSSGWVQARFYLLSLPVEIQQDAAAGFITQLQIKQLYSLPTVEEQYAAVRRIKEAKMKGEKVEHAGRKKRAPVTAKKERKPSEIFEMMEIVAKTLGYSLTTRFGAWATGSITTGEFFDDVRKAAEAAGKKFYPPAEF